MVTKRKSVTKKNIARKKKPVPRMHLHSPSTDLPRFHQNVTPQQYYGIVSNYGWEGPSIVDSASVRPAQPVPATPALRIRTASHRPAAPRPHPRAAASMRDKGPSFSDGMQDGMDPAHPEYDPHPLLLNADSPSFWNFYGGGPNRPPEYGPQVIFRNRQTDGLHFTSKRALEDFYENEALLEWHGGAAGKSKPHWHNRMDKARARLRAVPYARG